MRPKTGGPVLEYPKYAGRLAANEIPKFDVEHDPKYGKCHPNCDCGRFLEIGNNVFMQYKKEDDGSFSELPKMNVDFGGGLERILAAADNDQDIFNTDVFAHIVKEVEKITSSSYVEEKNKPTIRVIADHIRASVFLIKNDVYPSNKEQGYVLRRLLRRALLKLRSLKPDFKSADVSNIAKSVLTTYGSIYFEPVSDAEKITQIMSDEMKKFETSINKGMKIIEKMESVDAKAAFDLYQTYGFPLEITEEILKERGHSVDRKIFYEEFNKHKDLSRSSSAGKFKGGLADHSEQVLKYHTATHLIHQALFDTLGADVRQEGSNITGERLRFDFFTTKTPKQEEIKKVETIVTEKINKAMPVNFAILPKEDADKIGARSFFKEKYGDTVKVYFIGADKDNIVQAYSKEFCGGPHVMNTKDIGQIKIDKFKKIGSNLYRIYAS
jgi:alanyl-tRNA synthetase